MAFAERDNSAIIFPNFGKKQPKHPDFRGTGIIGGKKYDLSVWEKQGSRSKFFSIAFSEPRDQQPAPANEQPRANGPTTAAPAEKDDDIPF